MKKYKIIPIFVPHKGCPHQCAFCNQHRITGQLAGVTPGDVRQKVDQYLQTIDSEKHRVEVAFYGGSFTAIDKAARTALLAAAKAYKDGGKIHGIRLSTRPDYISGDILRELEDYGVTEIEMGVQSMCDEVLAANNRGHTAADVKAAVREIRRFGFGLGLQMMVGLIGDTVETSVRTAKEIAALKPDFVRVYPTLVFKNTPLYDRYLNGTYIPLSVEDAVAICVPVMRIFEESGVKVVRLGLLVGADEAQDSLAAGPYHPHFRELVEKRMSINVSETVGNAGV